MPVDEGGTTDAASAERRGRPSVESAPSPSSSALASYHQHLAALGGGLLGHHARETSAFVPVVPSRGLHLGGFDEGRKMELAAMMADKRKEIALREEAACVAAAHAAAVMFR